MEPEQAIDLIFKELKSAESKHPGWPIDPIHAAAIMAEEAGETLQAAIDFVYKDAPEEKAIIEAAQCGAMAIRFLLGIGTYERSRARQVETK
ncbi:MAG: hypothetical protein AB1427_00805 [Thermodesulfobacteriota bacterium]